MNQRSPITETSREKAIIDATMDLENEVNGLACMASILADLLDNNLTDVREGAKPPDENRSIRLTDAQMNNLCFAWNDVTNRATKLLERYYAAVSTD